MLKEVNKSEAYSIALKLKKEIIEYKQEVKNKKDKLVMIDFFLLSYNKDDETDYLFYSSIKEDCLMCIITSPPSTNNISEDHSYIECIVKGIDSKTTFTDFLNKAKELKKGKVALGAASLELVEFYKTHNFVFINEYKEDWSCIGDLSPHTGYTMTYKSPKPKPSRKKTNKY
jgi:hypothetical protein